MGGWHEFLRKCLHLHRDWIGTVTNPKILVVSSSVVHLSGFLSAKRTGLPTSSMNGLSGRYPTRIHFSGTLLVHRFEPLQRKRISIAKLREMEEEDDDIRAALEEAFGESSSSDGDGDGDDDGDEIQLGVDPNDEDRILGKSPNWERVGEINGLWICREFLSPDQQSSLLSAIDREGWFTEASCNQAMRFGDLPQWAMELAYLIREVVHYDNDAFETVDIEEDKEACILPSNILWREPIFDQLIVNVYQPGEGICAHVDLMRFDDGIAIISLESSCVMHFTRVKSGLENVQDSDPPQITKVPVYLAPGSLVIMWGEARYQWMHEINRKPGFQKWEEKDIDQRRRTSITLRKLCPNE